AFGPMTTLAMACFDPLSPRRGDRNLTAKLAELTEVAEQLQHDDGLIDLGASNFHSPPDTAFVVEDLVVLHEVIRDWGESCPERDEFLARLATIITRGCDGMVGTGVHTPNHRWKIASALTLADRLWPHESWAAEAQRYLDEGIDIDADGEFSERSTGCYNYVCDLSLILLGRALGSREYLGFADRNLEHMLHLLHADGTLYVLITGMRVPTRGPFTTKGVGLYRSRDAGESWRLVNKSYPLLYPKDFAVDPSDSKIIYVGACDAPTTMDQRVRNDQGGLHRTTDGGKTFKAVNLNDFSATVKGQVAAQVKITFKEALNALKLEAIVQNNSGALPYLSPGKNVVTVSVAERKALADNRLVVTYAYRLGSRSKSFEQMYDEDKEIAKAHDATWDDTIRCVQKTFTAKDLPAKFEIDCPTPKGRYPVYPRMLFVRREVLSPGQLPAVLPASPSTPKIGPNEELATLPSPWLIGPQLPPAVPVRATKSVVLPVKKVAYVTKKGEVFTHQFVKWLKDNSDAWVM
ncbi:hypothetical protein LCGC14_2440910, partial [marine sediment metagenome]